MKVCFSPCFRASVVKGFDSMHDLAITGIYFFFIALLYSTVGHAGASGYLATMALLSFPPAVMKPTALALNIIVALVTSIRFTRLDIFPGACSGPLPWLRSRWRISAAGSQYMPRYTRCWWVWRCCLRLHISSFEARPLRIREEGINRPGMAASLATGGVIGLISGLTGVGGGIFLSPVLIILNWAGLRKTSAIAAVFILLNSISGLAGFIQKGGALPDHLAWWSVAVISGGFIGSSLGATKFNSPVLRVLLGVVLLMAGVKLVTI